MKLPKSEEKFVITKEGSSLNGCIVSGVHVQIWPDDQSDTLWYYVYVQKVFYGDDVVYDKCIGAAESLERALDFIAEHLVPCEGSGEKADAGQGIGAAGEKPEKGASDERGLENVPGDQEEIGELAYVDHHGRRYGVGSHGHISPAKGIPGVSSGLGGVACV